MIQKRLIFTGILTLFITTGIFAQKILIIENNRSLKNFKYYPGDEILVKISNMEGRVTDLISDLSDSSVTFEFMGEVELNEILCIYRENWLIKRLWGLSLLGGTAYFGISSFNRLINNQDPVIDSETMIISGSLVAFSFALIPFELRKINTRGNWQMRIIDLGSYGN